MTFMHSSIHPLPVIQFRITGEAGTNQIQYCKFTIKTSRLNLIRSFEPWVFV